MSTFISLEEQPEVIIIDEYLRLRKFSEDCAFALDWYQDRDTLLLVDGADTPYTMERLLRMYHYLSQQGECYFIEVRTEPEDDFTPIGDVTFWQKDMPIVIGVPQWRGKGIGRKVVGALIQRAKLLGYSTLEVREIYHYNTASRRLFEGLGFRPWKKTNQGHSYRLELH